MSELFAWLSTGLLTKASRRWGSSSWSVPYVQPAPSLIPNTHPPAPPAIFQNLAVASAAATLLGEDPTHDVQAQCREAIKLWHFPHSCRHGQTGKVFYFLTSEPVVWSSGSQYMLKTFFKNAFEKSNILLSFFFVSALKCWINCFYDYFGVPHQRMICS